MESKHFCLFGSVFLLLLVGVGADPNSADLVVLFLSFYFVGTKFLISFREFLME